MKKNILTPLFIILGFAAAAMFILSPSFSLPLWGKVASGALWFINLYLSVNAEKWEEEGKFALHPTLAFIVQVGLSFLIVAITA